MKKIIKDSMKSDPPAKSEYPLFGSIQGDEISLEWESFRQRPTPTKVVIQYGKDLYKWASTDSTATKIRKFFRKHGIALSTIERWKVRVPEFRFYYDLALEEIGDRREDLALYKNGSEGLVIKTMANYDPDYRELLRWQAEINKKDDLAATKKDVEDSMKAMLGSIKSDQGKKENE